MLQRILRLGLLVSCSSFWAFGQSADLRILKSGPASVTPGTNITYTVTVTNLGPNNAANVVVTDAAPPGTSIVSETQTSGADSFSDNSAGSTFLFNAATMTSGNSDAFQLVVHVNSGLAAGSTITNVATVSSTTTDPNSNNNTSSVTSTVASADLAVSKAGPATVTAGTNVTYTVTVVNSGPNDAANVVVTDAAPPGTSIVSETQASGTDVFFDNSAGSTFRFNATSMTASSVDTFVLVVHVNSGLAGGTTITNTVTVSSSTPDPNPNNNSSSATSTVVAPTADLVIVKSGPATVTAGTNITYTVTVTNNGPNNAASVVVSDPVPPGTSIVSETQTAGADTFADATSGSTISFTAATVAAGNTDTFQFVVRAGSSIAANTIFTNTATVSSSTNDPNSSNNSSSSTSTVASSADVSISKSGPPSVAPGALVTYSLTVRNNGPSDAQSVQTVESPPPNTTLVSFVQNTGPAAGGTLPAGQSQTFTVVLRLGLVVAGGATLSNTATVTTSTADPNPGNNSSTTTATIQALSVPTLSEWSLVLLALLMMAMGMRALRPDSGSRAS